jgi:hypothetical protein
VVVGTVGLFGLAALIEGFLRQILIDTNLRLLVALVSVVLLTLYFTQAGRPDRSATLEDPA